MKKSLGAIWAHEERDVVDVAFQLEQGDELAVAADADKGESRPYESPSDRGDSSRPPIPTRVPGAQAHRILGRAARG